jgi:hypothetical protein
MRGRQHTLALPMALAGAGQGVLAGAATRAGRGLVAWVIHDSRVSAEPVM